MKKNRNITVVGGGIAGLTVACKLAGEGARVTLIEKEKVVGGLARSFRYGKYTFDIGPHRFYSSQKDVNDFLYSIMGNDLMEIERYSAVHYCERYHTWPLRLKSVFQMPLSVSIPAFFDLFTKTKFLKNNDDTFKNYILAKYGTTLYETFFRLYTEKFIGLPTDQVHFHWAKIGVERATIDEKIKTGSISQLFTLMLMPKPRQLNFLYPPGGIDVLCSRLREEIEKAGGRIITSATPTKINRQDKNITSLVVNGEEIYADAVIWTGSLNNLLDLLNFGPSNLNYLSLITYNIQLKEPPLQDYQWCYFGSNRIPFSRSTNPAQFNPALVPAGRGALCLELTCRQDDENWQKPEKLIDSMVEGLDRVRSITDKKSVSDVHFEKITDTYPVYDIKYLEKLSRVRNFLRNYHNLFLAGRTGLFWYNNMDHSIENAFHVADKVMGHSPETAHKRMEDPFHLGASVGDPQCAMI